MSGSLCPFRLFITYARQDQAHLLALNAQLVNLKGQGRVAVWAERVLEPSEQWPPKLQKALRDADILLCLVSPDFVNSNFLQDVELKQCLERAQRGQLRIIPVFVRPTDLTGHPLDGHVRERRHVRSITEWKHREQGWREVVAGLVAVLDRLLKLQTVPQPLPAGYEPLSAVHPPSALLRARHRVVPFLQALRATELERIHTWLEHERRFDVLLVTGDAGSGKSRLLYEVIERQRESGWVAGLVSSRSASEEQKESLKEAFAAPHRLLVVLDDAEFCPGLATLLDGIYAESQKRSQRVRVLLASRIEGDWWPNLQAAVDPSVSSRLKTPHVALGANQSESSSGPLQALYEASLRSFAAALNVPTPAPSRFQSVEPSPLIVLCAALTTLLGLPTEQEGLLHELVKYEERFWLTGLPAGFKRQKTVGFLLRVMAATTLRGGLASEGELQALLQRMDVESTAETEVVKELVRRWYGGGAAERWLNPIEPGPLGVALVWRCLSKDKWWTILEQTFSDEAPEALMTALMLLDDVGQYDETLSKAGAILLMEKDLEARALPAVQAAIRWRSEDLQPVAAYALSEVICRSDTLDVLLRVSEVLPLRSRALVQLRFSLALELQSVRFRQNGIHLPATERAIGLLRQMRVEVGGFFEQHLASALNLQGRELKQLGRFDEAILSIQEAITLYECLAEEAPVLFYNALGTSYSFLSEVLNLLGRREEALHALQAAISQFRQVQGRERSAVFPAFINSLNSLSVMLGSFGRRAEALEAAQEAVSLFRRLPKKRRDTASSSFAASLHQLSAAFILLQRWPEAFKASAEAEALFRALWEQQPETYTPALVASLLHKGYALKWLWRMVDALVTSREAVAVLTPYYQKHPQMHGHLWFVAAHNLRECLQQANIAPDLDDELQDYMTMLAQLEGQLSKA